MDQERAVPEEASGGAEEEGEGQPHEGEHTDEACIQHHHHHNHHHHQVCVLKFDHFENIHRLDPKLPSYEGAPNFRQVMIVLMVIISQFGCNVYKGLSLHERS